MSSTVILTYYRKDKMTNYVDTFYNLETCYKKKTCKKCLSAGHCAWTTDNTCVLIPQNITGHITTKLECPTQEAVDEIKGTDGAMDSMPAPTEDTINVSLSQPSSSGSSGQSNSLLAGVPLFVSQQNLLAQQQAVAAADSQSDAIARRAAGNAEAIVAGAAAADAARQHNQYGGTMLPRKK